jgi:hypothetical protein
MCLSANPDDHIQYARHHIELGFTRIFYDCAGPDQRAFLEANGRQVLPMVGERVLQPAQPL